jgi:hypothetical protein
VEALVVASIIMTTTTATSITGTKGRLLKLQLVMEIAHGRFEVDVDVAHFLFETPFDGLFELFYGWCE